MESYSLYEGSPVFGDLMGLTPDVSLGVYGGQDGAPGKSGPIQLIQGHEESSSLQDGLLGPLEFGWMDSNVDLLQFLTGEEVAPLEPQPTTLKMVAEPVASSSESITEADSAIAVEILKSVAEDTTKMLDSGSDPAVNESPSQDSIGIDWLDVLDEEVNQAFADYVVTDVSGPVLSPVSADDVESVLSSGATSPSGSQSPSQETSGEWPSIIPMELDSPDTIEASVFGEVQVSQSDLECLLAQVKSVPSDHSYPSVVPPDSIKGPTSSRPKPYSRKNTSKSSGKNASKATKPDNRHERKKQQNKDAAVRYRLKKRQEAGIIDTEVDSLEARNTELKDTVEQITREIKYLKDLLSDVYKTKEFMKSQ